MVLCILPCELFEKTGGLGMAGKPRFIVRLPVEERKSLERMVSSGRDAARKLLRARILLKADVSTGEIRWSDEEIAEALETSYLTVYRVRKQWVEEGMEAVLSRRKPNGRQYRKLDGAQEARLIALACSPPPEGRTRWTMQLLADKLVELKIVDGISDDTVHRTLKKTISSRG
jgi:transposase